MREFPISISVKLERLVHLLKLKEKILLIWSTLVANIYSICYHCFLNEAEEWGIFADCNRSELKKLLKKVAKMRGEQMSDFVRRGDGVIRNEKEK